MLNERRRARALRKRYLRVRAKANSFVPAQTYIPLSCPRNLHHKAPFHFRLRRFNVADGPRAEHSYISNKGTLFVELLLSKWEPKDVREPRRPSFAKAEKLTTDMFPNSLPQKFVLSIYLLLSPGAIFCLHNPCRRVETRSSIRNGTSSPAELSRGFSGGLIIAERCGLLVLSGERNRIRVPRPSYCSSAQRNAHLPSQAFKTIGFLSKT